ncbi:MAG TPA: hypothetical protein VF762_01030 [Blastocatellia bacterium]|jgi:hypothetical protein
MNNDGRRSLLRPEAGPIPFYKLQRSAQDALYQIISALAETVENAKGTDREQTISDIDTNRTSRLFFVSGEPGSGKSTVYLTLKAMTSPGEKFAYYGTGYHNEGELKNLKKAIRWLEPLDLEVAGEERENLLAAVLVRLFETLDQFGNSLSKSCDAAIKDLEELATGIGIAWEGNLRKRAGSLDPATFSEEVMHTQRARLGVNHRLRKALDDIARNRCCGCDEDTLFVLPVEDLYLKPDASLQLLRLLRMISVPRLFFLLLGDLKTVEALFTEKSLADWTDVAGPETFAPDSERLNEALARARELRARYLRKLLPPGQRTFIEVMDWDEALIFSPEPISEAPTLESLLSDIPLDDLSEFSESKTLLTFLVSPLSRSKMPRKLAKGSLAMSKQKEQNRLDKQRKDAQAAYTALQILDATPREIMDLWFDLNRYGNHNDPSEVHRLIGRFTKLEVDEQSFLNESEQNTLLEIFPTRHYFDQELDLSPLQLAPERSRWEKGVETSTRLWVRSHRYWRLTVDVVEKANPRSTSSRNGDTAGRLGQFNKLPPRPAAWIALLHDLSFNPSGNVIGSPVVRLCKRLEVKPDSENDQDIPPSDDFGWAVLKQGQKYHHFPMPIFITSFRALDRFLHVWNTGLEWYRKTPAKDEQTQLDRIINLWGLAGCLIDDHAYAEFADRDEDWFNQQLVMSKTTRLRSSKCPPKYRKWIEAVRKFEKEQLRRLTS